MVELVGAVGEVAALAALDAAVAVAGGGWDGDCLCLVHVMRERKGQLALLKEVVQKDGHLIAI